MLNLRYVADEKKLDLDKYVDGVDFTALRMSDSGKTYKVSHDQVKFEVDGLEITGALTLYARRTVYEDWQVLRSKGMEERGELTPQNRHDEEIADLHTQVHDLKQMLAQALEAMQK